MGFNTIEEVAEALDGMQISITRASSLLSRGGPLSESDRQANHSLLDTKRQELDAIWGDLNSRVWKVDLDEVAKVKSHIEALKQVIADTKE